MLFSTIQKGVKEAIDTARIVRRKLHRGSVFFIFLDICCCFLLYGARPRDYVMFEFYFQNHRRRNQCFTTFRFFKLMRKLDYDTRKYKIHNNKENQLKLYSSFIKRNWLTVDETTSVEEILTFIGKSGKVIVKPNGGTYGKGIFQIEGESDPNIDLLLHRKLTDKFLVEEIASNIEELSKFNKTSLNTFRVYTFTTKFGVTEILGVMLRVGRKGAIVDNWGAGGIGYNFDVETGVCDQPGRDKNMNPYVFHPDTEYQMVGYRIPRYRELLEYVQNLVKVVPEARYVGWDIALTPKGFDLIEMNCPGGNDFLQAFGKYYNDYIKDNW